MGGKTIGMYIRLLLGFVITFRFLAIFAYVTALPAAEALGQISRYKYSVINAKIGNVDLIWKGDINIYLDINLPSTRHDMGEAFGFNSKGYGSDRDNDF